MFSPCSPAVLSTQRFRESIAREISSSLLLIKAKSLISSSPVSYTHLDVYKRQISGSLLALLLELVGDVAVGVVVGLRELLRIQF